MPQLGAHMSIAGGYYKAVEAAAAEGCDCVQLFTKNNNQWRAKPIADDEAARFQQALGDRRIGQPLSHTSYLINIAAPDPALWRKSVDALIVELERAAQLGIPYVVLHPGAHTTSTPAEGLAAAARALDEALDGTPATPAAILLETTAGQGSCLGARFEELAELLQRSRHPERLGVCLDTCHVFAAGYPLADQADYRQTMQAFDDIVGLDQLRAIHLNDSKRELGSRVDRHEHIGHGRIGLEGFRQLLNDPRLAHLPMYLETPKGDHEGQSWDRINLATLRSLVAEPGAQKPARRAKRS